MVQRLWDPLLRICGDPLLQGRTDRRTVADLDPGLVLTDRPRRTGTALDPDPREDTVVDRPRRGRSTHECARGSLPEDLDSRRWEQ